MSLRDFLSILYRRKSVVMLSVLIVVVVVAISNLRTTPVYTASAKLRVSAGGVGSADASSLAMNLDRVMSTYIDLATSRPVLEEMALRLDLKGGPPLKDRVKAEIVPTTELIMLSIDDFDPALARDEANTLAKVLTERSVAFYVGSVKTTQEVLNQQLAEIGQELDDARARYTKDNIPPSIELKQNTYASLLQQYEQGRLSEAARANILSVVEPAVAPDSPSKPRTAQNLALGAAIGLITGFGLLLLFENLDTRLYSVEQITKVVELTPLGSIPTDRRLRHCDRYNSDSREGAAFRRLLVNILAHNAGQPLRTLLVTSASANEGKSTVVGNLACAMTRSGQRVIVVDGDFRSPSMHRLFGLSNRIGLSNVLMGEVDVREAIQTSSTDGIALLASGPSRGDAPERHHLGNITKVLEHLAQQFDIVLLDGPDLLSEPDVALLASWVQGVLLVVALARSREDTLRSARRQLTDVKARLIGVVLNRA
jgi:polysaccharide biosynthesis transport protein